MGAGELRRQRRGLHHFIVTQRVQGIPGLTIPVLYLAEGEHPDETLVPVMSLIDYLVAHSAQSRTWMMQRARSLGLFYDYLRQQWSEIQEARHGQQINLHRVALARFQNLLVRGSIDASSGTPVDRTGLYWQPQSSPDRSMDLIRGLADYLKWLDVGGFGDSLREVIPTDARGLGGPALMSFLYVARYREQFDFLVHLKTHRKPGSKTSRAVVGKTNRGVGLPDVARFPVKHLRQLFAVAFKRVSRDGSSGGPEDVTAKLAAMLCAFGGLRGSEPLHLWANDVTWENGAPLVVLNHPVNAMIHVKSRGQITRERCLEELYGMVPRSLQGGKFWSGWKSVACDKNHQAILYWLPVEGVQEVFWRTYETYIHEVRPPLMRARHRRGLPDHPFLLVSSGSANQSGDETSVGDPYTRRAFRGAWERAIGRLRKATGDEQLVVSKPLGTTLHGLRHLYGGLLADCGMSERGIQIAMHHLSRESQEVYTRPSAASFNDELMKVRGSLANRQLSTFREIEG